MNLTGHVEVRRLPESSRTMTGPPDMNSAEAPECPDGTAGATLRADPHPSLVKIRSVRVETSAVFSHLYEDGSICINDYEADDE